MTTVIVCKTLDTAGMMRKGVKGTTAKGRNRMATTTKDEDDRRLTAVQKDIRDRCDKLPKRLRRSIDQFRTSVGMVPLWGSSPQQQRQRRA